MRSFLVILCSLVCLYSCSVQYSFTGTSTGDAKTISIDYLPSYAELVPPNYSIQLTEALKDIYLQQTKLDLVRSGGDMQISGEVTGYSIRPNAIQAESASQSRLTVTVKIRFVNTKNEVQSFDKSFSRFQDFDASQDISQVEDELLLQITDQLTQDILQESIGNW